MLPILRLLISYSIAIKSGEIQQEAIADLRKKRIQEIDESPADTKDKILFKNLLHAKHLFMNPSMVFPNESWWQTFFNKGISDIQQLEESIQSSKYFQDENTPDWIKLWHYREFSSDEEFDKVFEKVRLAYEANEYEDIGVIKHIFGMFLLFSDAGVDTRSRAEILQDGKLYVDYLRFHRRTIFINSKANHDWGSYKSLGFYEVATKEFQDFSAYLVKSQEHAIEESVPDEAQNLLDIMQNDIWRFYRMLHSDHDNSQHDELSRLYRKIPILKSISVQKFMQKLLSMSFENQQGVFWALAGRYKPVDIYTRLLEELDWLKEFRFALLEEINRKHGKISGLILKSYVDAYLNGLIDRLEVKKEQKDS
ncbi:MAG: hypothetical protein ACTS2F_17415 [Thainema sp.]